MKCILNPGDHGFIKRLSTINFQDAGMCYFEKIVEALSKGLFQANIKANDELINKIQHAFLESMDTTPEMKKNVKASLQIT